MCYVGFTMTEPNFKLQNPPIVEAVLDIECDLYPSFQLSDFEGQAGQVFLESYPKPRQLFLHEHKIKKGLESSPEMSFRQSIKALQFLKDDEKQLVQVRDSGFSFNRLAPYTSLDDYLPEIERTWGLFVGLVKPVQIRSIRLRFINRILIPFESGAVDLDLYFKIAPKMPEEGKLALTGFLNHYQAKEIETGSQINIVLTAQQPEGDKLPVIFDNTVLAPISCGPGEWNEISGKILVLRDLKNRIFRKALTQQCLNLFQQL